MCLGYWAKFKCKVRLSLGCVGLGFSLWLCRFKAIWAKRVLVLSLGLMGFGLFWFK